MPPIYTKHATPPGLFTTEEVACSYLNIPQCNYQLLPTQRPVDGGEVRAAVARPLRGGVEFLGEVGQR